MLQDPHTLTLRDYLVPVYKRRWMIVALVVVITAVVTVYYASRPLTYVASTQVYIGATSGLNTGPSAPTTEGLANQATLLTSSEDTAVVAKKLGYPAGSVPGTVTATPSTTTNFLNISASAASSAVAAHIANAFAQQFIAQNTSSQVSADDAQLAVLKKQLRSLKGAQAASQRPSIESQIQQLQLAAGSAVGSATQINVPSGGSPSSHPVVEYAVLAALGALIGGILLAFLFERLDPRLKGIQHTEQVYQHPVLATVWHDPEIDYFVEDKPGLSPRSREAFRDLRVGLSLAATHLDTRSIIITSAIPDEGKSTVARNLALALAEAGRRVILVDADFRKPSLPKTLGQEHKSGLAELLAGTRTLGEVLTDVQIDVPKAKTASRNGRHASPNGNNGATGPDPDDSAFHVSERSQPSLTFLQSGAKPPNPQGLLESDGFHALLDKLRSSFDTIVLDSTPLTLVSDAIPVVRNVDGILLVARSSTDARTARHAAEIIRRVPEANVIGLVVNDVPETAAAAYGKGYGYGYYGYGYGHRYGYGYGDEPEATGEEAAAQTAPQAPNP